MRKISYCLLCGVLAMLMIGAAEPIPVEDHAGTQADPMLVYNSPTVAVVFDDAYTGVSLVRIDTEVMNPAGEVLATWTVTTWNTEPGAIKVPIRAQATTLPNGVYQIRVRVWDNFGNVSAWSTPLWVTKQWRDLPTPGGCRTTS